MSTLDAARRHIRRRGAGGEAAFRLSRLVLLVILLLGAVLAMAEMNLLSTQSADDVGSILFHESQ